MADRNGIELARVGEFDISTGKQTFTVGMLHDAARRATAAGPGFRAPVKLGHTDPRNLEAAAEDGEPAFGWVHNVRVEGEGDDSVLMGDITGMPQWLADCAPSAYPDRSIEGYAAAERDYLDMNALALLGVTPPGISTIKSWRELPAALAAAEGTPRLIAASFTAVHDVEPAPTVAPPTPAEPPVIPTPNPEGADTMSDTLSKGLRERLGVAEDADEATILAALDETLAEQAEPPAAVEPPAPAPVPEGSVLVNASALEELRIAARAGQDARAVQLRQDRDDTIAAAIRGGFMAPARKDHWIAQWDKDPEGIRAAIAEMTAGDSLFPVAASGYGSDPAEDNADPAAGDNYWFPGARVPTTVEG